MTYGKYSYDVIETDFTTKMGATCDYATNTVDGDIDATNCNHDTCLIDLEYAKQIYDFVEMAGGQLNNIVTVDADNVCASNNNPSYEKKICSGTAPFKVAIVDPNA